MGLIACTILLAVFHDPVYKLCRRARIKFLVWLVTKQRAAREDVVNVLTRMKPRFRTTLFGRLVYGPILNPLDDAMAHAASCGQLQNVEIFLNRGANPNCTDGLNVPILVTAVQRKHYAVAHALLRAGAMPDVRFALRGTYLLSYCAANGDEAAVKLLLEAGANPNVVTWTGIAPLASASTKGHLEIVKMLLEHGADPTKVSIFGNNAMQLAKWKKHADVISLLDASFPLTQSKKRPAAPGLE